MENASKALIIAGAILLAILLISLGIMIFSQAQDTVTGSGMSEAELTAFNNKFLKYEGVQKGTMVKALCQDIMATNSDSTNKDGVTVKFTLKKKDDSVEFSTSDSTAMDTSKIKNNNSYDVTMKYGAGNRISEIEAKAQK